MFWTADLRGKGPLARYALTEGSVLSAAEGLSSCIASHGRSPERQERMRAMHGQDKKTQHVAVSARTRALAMRSTEIQNLKLLRGRVEKAVVHFFSHPPVLSLRLTRQTN